MTTDLYTKSVLTVIAAALIFLCVQAGIRPPAVAAQAPATPPRVAVADQYNHALTLVSASGGYAIPVVLVTK
jgi:hypothetical protein